MVTVSDTTKLVAMVVTADLGDDKCVNEIDGNKVAAVSMTVPEVVVVAVVL